MVSEHFLLQQDLSILWYWILGFFYRYFAGTGHLSGVWRGSFWMLIFLFKEAKKGTSFSSDIVSCGISAIICHFCPLLGSCMRREQKQSNPGTYSMGGRGAVTLPYCSFGFRNRRVVTVGSSSFCTSIHLTGLTRTKTIPHKQATVTFKICQCVIRQSDHYACMLECFHKLSSVLFN